MQQNQTLDGYYKQLNSETREHCERVAWLSKAVAEYVGLNENLAFTIGLYHDVGKIYVPSRILRKDSGLTSLEREIVDLHSYYGYGIIKETGMGPDIYIPVLYHHGFNKNKLSEIKEQVSMDNLRYIQIVHLVDIYDAMRAKRVYRDPCGKEEVINALLQDTLCNDIIIDFMQKGRGQSAIQTKIHNDVS